MLKHYTIGKPVYFPLNGAALVKKMNLWAVLTKTCQIFCASAKQLILLFMSQLLTLGPNSILQDDNARMTNTTRWQKGNQW